MSTETDALEAAIESVAGRPASVSGDAGSVTQQNLGDLIAAHKYFSNLAAANTQTRGLRFNALIPDGTVNRRRRPFGPLWREI